MRQSRMGLPALLGATTFPMVAVSRCTLAPPAALFYVDVKSVSVRLLAV